MYGTVKIFFPEKGYGFIVDKKGEERFFHISFVQEEFADAIYNGTPVEFEPSQNEKGQIATSVKIYKPEIPVKFTRKRMEFFQEVKSWKMEAKNEDNRRYFYHCDEVNLLENGDKCYVIGRKGTGKTAICEHLTSNFSSDVISKKLSFKSFPFNELYKLQNDNFRYPNQYITLWKYIIYSELAQLMMCNPKINEKARNSLAKVYSSDLEIALGKKIAKWTGAEFSLKIFTISLERVFDVESTSWIDRVDILEKFIKENIDNSRYIIAFDELDEDYINIGEEPSNPYYSALLTSLFKAVQDVKYTFKSSNRQILPVIFLRDDIFMQLNDPDKTKWDDLIYELNWNVQQIKNLLAFRLSRSWGMDEKIRGFDEAWANVFSREPIRNGTQYVPIFKRILSHTHHRPRDFIRFINECASVALDKRSPVITPDIIFLAQKSYSDYFRRELEDEIHGILPEIKDIFKILTKLEKNTFNAAQLKEIYLSYVKSSNLIAKSFQDILEILFNFSIIGYWGKNRFVFRYFDKHASLNPNKSFYIHRGLISSLNL